VFVFAGNALPSTVGNGDIDAAGGRLVVVAVAIGTNVVADAAIGAGFVVDVDDSMFFVADNATDGRVVVVGICVVHATHAQMAGFVEQSCLERQQTRREKLHSDHTKQFVSPATCN
jgi:hypothetical protein